MGLRVLIIVIHVVFRSLYTLIRCMDITVTTGQPECKCNTPDKDSIRPSNKEVIEQIFSYNIRLMGIITAK